MVPGLMQDHADDTEGPTTWGEGLQVYLGAHCGNIPEACLDVRKR